MRSRNIKPGFFKNEELGQLTPQIRLLFIALWCLADREGRLEDRPLRIKAEAFPYDNLDIALAMTELENKNLIRRYIVDGNYYINIPNFKRHQTPHVRETDSTLPSPRHGLGNVKPSPRSPDSLIPDVLIPDSLNPDVLNPDILPNTALAGILKIKEWFLKTWNAYPKERRHGKEVAFKRYQKAVKTLEDAKEVARALDNYLKSKTVKDGFILRGSKWFDEWQDWQIERREYDDRRSSESLHPADAGEQADRASQGARVQSDVAYRVVKQLSDSKTFQS